MSDFGTVLTALDVVSTSTRGISAVDRPVVTASQLVSRPGVHPSVTFPMTGTALPGVHGLWAQLAEPADFFGIPMPPPDTLSECLSAFATALCPAPALTAVTVTLVAGAGDVVVTGAAVPSRGPSVRLAACDIDFPLTRRTDDHWRRMAARTTSRADRDQLRRWLARRGAADGVATGSATPFLGALVYTRGARAFGVDNPEPVSVLDQLRRCGAIGDVRSVESPPTDAEHVWWISPEYRIHPVTAVGHATYPVAAGVPAFARLP